MVEIPKDEVTLADLAEWYKLKEELNRIKNAEMLIRSRIFKYYFPNPEEGTNTAPLNDGTGAVIKGTHKIDRKVDPGSLDGLKDAMAQEGYNGPKLNLDVLVRYKPELSISAYRTLTEEEMNFFDQALIIKPGSPTVEITIPKKAAAKK